MRITCLFVLVISYFQILAQEFVIDRNGLIKASASISPSFMLGNDSRNIYLSGFAEYYSNDKISIRGDSFWFIDGQEDFAFFEQAIRTNFGMFLHHGKKNFEVNFGIQPGLSVLRKNPYEQGINTFAPLYEKTRFVPSIAITTGCNLFVWKYFNFYASVTYIQSDFISIYNGQVNADELIISTGLGFQIRTRRKD